MNKIQPQINGKLGQWPQSFNAPKAPQDIIRISLSQLLKHFLFSLYIVYAN